MRETRDSTYIINLIAHFTSAEKKQQMKYKCSSEYMRIWLLLLLQNSQITFHNFAFNGLSFHCDHRMYVYLAGVKTESEIREG